MMSAAGLSKTRLGRMADVMRGYVERGEVAGVVTLLCRHDEVHVEAIGQQDLAAATPMRRDTIFRIASMTKPITAAAMIFVEEDSHGWGFGLSVITRRDGVGPSSGSFGWDGGFHTSCYVDPHEDMVAILLAQRLMTSPTPSDFYADFWTLAYQAIDD
jgi:CubicO group peptidase (beta-lactamase class C family)